jgi:hypothetical protein
VLVSSGVAATGFFKIDMRMRSLSPISILPKTSKQREGVRAMVVDDQREGKVLERSCDGVLSRDFSPARLDRKERGRLQSMPISCMAGLLLCHALMSIGMIQMDKLGGLREDADES